MYVGMDSGTHYILEVTVTLQLRERPFVIAIASGANGIIGKYDYEISRYYLTQWL